MSEDPVSGESAGLPRVRLCVGVTGHREDNPAFADHRDGIEAALAAVFGALDEAAAALPGTPAPTRLHSLLAPGADMLAMELALGRGWEVVAPLPFGLDLCIALNCREANEEDARTLLAGGEASAPAVAAQAQAMRALATRVRCFALAEQDVLVAESFIATRTAPGDETAATHHTVITSERAAVAARIMIEQSDLLVAIWDGFSPGSIGGTRHSIENALYHGAPVVWIDASDPASIRLLEGPDALELIEPAQDIAALRELVARRIAPPDGDYGGHAAHFHAERAPARSSRRFHAYRRIETIFGGAGVSRFFRSLVERYEAPEAVAEGSAAPVLAAAHALPGADSGFVERIHHLLHRFARADAVSTWLSDAYRGGMVMNFLLSALAVIAGVAYLPLVGVDWKWPFALAELVLLLFIVAITMVGRRRRWHGRWLETRRIAEYLRHAPILLLLGVARPAARWPHGSNSRWPEYYARQALRALGLPSIVVTQAYLRAALSALLARQAIAQRDYHRAKAAKLARVHHRLDRLSESLFVLAIVSVLAYLLLLVAEALGLVPPRTAEDLAKPLTFLGLALPALGGAFAGIRYLGDFERFAAISEVAARKLDALAGRIETLLSAPEPELRYAQVASLAHALDDVVIEEIESWQSVFAVKNMAVPV